MFFLIFLEIRKEEMRLLQITAYCQSLTMSLASTVPIISAIVTFLSHIAAGNNLTPSQVSFLKKIFNLFFFKLSVCYILSGILSTFVFEIRRKTSDFSDI